jgi:hypothetical protein
MTRSYTGNSSTEHFTYVAIEIRLQYKKGNAAEGGFLSIRLWTDITRYRFELKCSITLFLFHVEQNENIQPVGLLQAGYQKIVCDKF